MRLSSFDRSVKGGRARHFAGRSLGSMSTGRGLLRMSGSVGLTTGTGRALILVLPSLPMEILRWSSHISKRSSTGGLRGSGLAIENVYLGLRERRGPQYLAEPVEALGEPTPVSRPTAFSGSDGLAALAEFYLGERAERPNLYVP